jgi:probable selenium-dependent hydroxylase accessory protein YqeC
MSLLAALHLNPNDRGLICLIGAGGKTTTMFIIAAVLKALGKKVLVTTTTKIFHPEKNQYDSILFDPSGTISLVETCRPGTITCLGKELNTTDNKIFGIEKEIADGIFNEALFDFILVEGDGAKNKPIKAPGTREPVIPGKTTLTLGVIGLDALGKPVNDDNVHRLEQFCTITGAKENDLIDESIITRLITSPNGIFKSVPENSKRMVLLNKADTLPSHEIAVLISRNVRAKNNRIQLAVISAKESRVFK